LTSARSGTLSQICCAAWSHKHVLTGCWRRGDGICCTPLDLMGPGNLKLLSIQSESDWIESQLKIRMWHSCEKRRVRQWMGAQGQAHAALAPSRPQGGEGGEGRRRRGVVGGSGGAAVAGGAGACKPPWDPVCKMGPQYNVKTARRLPCSTLACSPDAELKPPTPHPSPFIIIKG